MKKVTLVVEISVTVPDNTYLDGLHLGNARTDFRIEESGMPVEGAEVTGYTTVNVLDDSGDEVEAEPMDDEA